MKYAIIRNNKVENVAVASPEFALQQGWIECPPDVWPGWGYNEGQFEPPSRDIDAEWLAIRQERNSRLAGTDMHVLSDRWITYSLDKQQEWSDYRQALRDIPQSFADPADVVWPTKPE